VLQVGVANIKMFVPIGLSVGSDLSDCTKQMLNRSR